MTDGLDGFPLVAPRLPRPVVFGQRWSSVAFVHWPVDPVDVEFMFPPGTRPDVWQDGCTYVGLIPFQMRDAGLGARLPLPYFGRFLETNIRMYSIDAAGRHGVLFRSLDTQRLAVLPFARLLFGVPYTWARMSTERSDTTIAYESWRRWPERGLHSRLVVRVGAVTEPTPLESWLTARWGAHARIAGRTRWVPNQHDAWPLHSAVVEELDDELLAASGVQVAGPPLRALWSPGVRTRFGWPSNADPG